MRTSAVPLSDIKIRNLKSGDKAYKVSDFGGLFILIKVSGAKSWRFKYRIDGKEKLLVTGNYPAVTVAKARLARDAAKALLADGVDPNEAKQKIGKFGWKPTDRPPKRSATPFSPSSARRESRQQHYQRPNIT